MPTVRVRNTEHSFEIQGNESLLEAAIRDGLSLPYGCSSGNCGLCRAQLLEGELQLLRPHDFHFSAAERTQGNFLMCCNSAKSDVTVAADIATDVDTIPTQTLQAKVKSADRISEQLMLLKLRVPRSQRLRFMAGQYAVLSLDDDTTSPGAIASCPCDERFIDFHVRRLPHDAFSENVFSTLRLGSNITVRAPYGRFAFDENSTRPALFIAFDTGFAAIKSILEHVTARESEQMLHLYRICCQKEDLYMDNLCRAWADALDELNYTPLVIGEALEELFDDEATGLDRVATMLEQVTTDHPDLSNYDVYVCAPETVVERFETLARPCGLEREQFHAEIIRGNSYTQCLGLST